MASLLTSDQVNYLIWKYLQESGFDSSACSFQNQSKADRLDDLYRPVVRSGCLIYLIQRGLQYEELRSQVEASGTVRKSTKPLQFFPPTPVPIEEEGRVGPANGHFDEDEDDNEPVNGPLHSPPTSVPPPARKHGMQDDGVNGVPKRRKRERKQAGLPDGDTVMVDAHASSPAPEEPRITNGRSLGIQIGEIAEELAESVILGDDDSDEQIFTCQWNPVHPTLLATAGTGPTARIRNVPADASPSESLDSIVVSHEPATSRADINVLRWSPVGDRLATGSYDGQTRIWQVDGVLEHTLLLHCAPVSELVWNQTGSILLVLNCDGNVIAWDTTSGESLDAFDMGQETITDIEWVDESQFVACGETSGRVFYIDVRQHKVESKQAHAGEIRCIRWDDLTETIASGGVDTSISIWQRPLKGSSPEKLGGHAGAVTEVAWQPKALPSAVSSSRILASASEDHTVRLWELNSRACLFILDRHNYPIERIRFSPNGKLLASGTNGKVILWNTDSGELTHIYDCSKSAHKNGMVAGSLDDLEVNDISWDESGDRIAIGVGHRRCAIVRLRNSP